MSGQGTVPVQRPGMAATSMTSQIQRPAAAASTSASPAQEFVVRVPQVTNKKYSIMKFGRSRDVDFTKCGNSALARENNLKEFKQANDLDQMPKFGAGSEYGRERRDIARKKKYGVMLKNYRADEQPWQLKVGKGKESKTYKGTKEGGILENASYYIFSKCPDGAFEAHPVEEWYNFNPVINYKYLNSEEAEEEFLRRDKTLNYFSIMLKKRLNAEDDAELDGEKSGKVKGKKKKKSDLMLTDMDDWAALSDDDIVDSDEEGEEDEKKSKKPQAPKKSKRKARRNSEDEAMEESDEMDEGQEVDYMTDTDSDDEEMYNQEGREKLDKYEEKGVADEEALRKQLDSDEEDEEEEKKDDENPEEEEEESQSKKVSDSDSSSSSDSDSDVEKEENFSSALFMPKKKEKSGSGRNTPVDKVKKGSKSRTPTPTEKNDSVGGLKRKGDDRKSPLPKKSKTESPVPETEGGSPTEDIDLTKKNTFIPINCEGISEDAVRRYLIRKPMTIKDLLHKFKSKKTGLKNEQLVHAIVTLLKKINPEKQSIDGKMHLYLKHE